MGGDVICYVSEEDVALVHTSLDFSCTNWVPKKKPFWSFLFGG
jgi:hypothetical protein